MFLSAQFEIKRLWPREDESAFEYWLSFSPMAPVFGVNWRFGDLMAEADPFSSPATAAVSRAAARSAKPKKRTPKVKVEDATVVEPAPKPAPAPAEAKPAPAPAPAEAKGEPVKTAPAKAPSAPAPEAEAPAGPDDLTAIKGIGPKMAEKLNAKGVTTYAQIAKWTKAKVAKMDAELGGLPGAIERTDWVGQAKSLAG